jgi:hypothetical protein
MALAVRESRIEDRGSRVEGQEARVRESNVQGVGRPRRRASTARACTIPSEREPVGRATLRLRRLDSRGPAALRTDKASGRKGVRCLPIPRRWASMELDARGNLPQARVYEGYSVPFSIK